MFGGDNRVAARMPWLGIHRQTDSPQRGSEKKADQLPEFQLH